MVNGNLPDGWKRLTGKDLFTWSSGKGLTQVELREGKIPVYGGNGINGYHNSALVNQPTLLVGRVGALCGNVYITKGSAWITDNAIYAKTISKDIDLRFAKIVFSEANLNQKAAGSGQPFVNQRMLNEVSVPLPPLPEQERIVAKIEELFTQLDAGTSALERVQAGLRRYKASVLKAGMNGTLFGGGKINNELPEGWRSVQLADVLAEPLSNGKSTPNAEDGFPVLRLTALKDGRIDLQERKIGAWTKEQAKNYLVKQGDFFVSRGNGSLHLVGRGGLVEQEPDAVAYPDTLIRIRVSPTDCDIKYLRTIWNSNFIRNQIETTARTTAGIYKINQNDLEGFTFPLPPLEEQRRIVAEVERRLSMAREVESVVEKALARSARLRQAVLKSAFEGKLLSFDGNKT